MLCEMCGKEVETTTRVRIEGSVIFVCSDCAKFGQPVDPVPAPPSSAPMTRVRAAPVGAGARIGAPRRRLEERDLYQEIGELELAPDWHRRVRIARETLAWTPEVLAKKLNEKKSVVLKLESGNIHPPDDLVRKLEHLLKIRLRAEEGAAGGE
jgi:putative transcription factor